MKAAVWYGRKDVRVLDIPEPPDPGPGMVKVKVGWTGICGSDLHEYAAGPIFIPTSDVHPLTHQKAPLTLGHEFAGNVVAVGKDVKNVKEGDMVAPDACWYCGECSMCKQGRYSVCEKLAFTGLMGDGAFAEYVNVPAYTMYKLPPGIPADIGALVEPLSVGVHAIRRGRVLEGDTVAIVGAGTIGLVTLEAAWAAGASKIIVLEMAKDRKEFARKLHATAVLDPREVDVVQEVKNLTDGLGVTVAIECVGGSDTLPLALSLVQRGGRVVVVGIFEKANLVHPNEIVFNEKEIYGSLAYSGEFATAISLLADGRITGESLITGRIKLDDIVEKGFEELLAHRDRNIKIIVDPN